MTCQHLWIILCHLLETGRKGTEELVEEGKARNEPVITKTCLFKCIENFTTKKGKFSNKNSDIFHISA